jgi:hypothetical protein
MNTARTDNRWDDSYYGITRELPMHPNWIEWLEKECLQDVEVDLLVRFHDMPRSRRIRTRIYWDEYDESLAKASWSDMSPVIGCTGYVIGCPKCLSHRQATNTAGDNMWCPQKNNANSVEKCFWGENDIDDGLCDGCVFNTDSGCGWGSHDCNDCINDNHWMDTIAQACAECGPCLADHGNDDDEWPHCRQVCPDIIGIKIDICG